MQTNRIINDEDVMTQSSALAYLDTTVREAVDRENRNPTVPALVTLQAQTAAKRTVSGFEVYDPEAQSRTITGFQSGRRSAIAQYYAGCDTLRRKLKNVGITPLAFVPLKAWNDLCQKSGLIRLCPDRDNTVRVSTKHLEKIEKRVARVAETTIPRMLLFGITTALLVLGTYQHGFDWKWAPWSIATFICTWVALCWVYSPDIVYSLLLGRAIRKFARKPHEDIVRAFFPDGVEVEDRNAYRTGVRFPEPPREVADTLLKLQRLDTAIHIAVVPEAVCFLESPGDILRKSQRQLDEEERARLLEAARQHDPIICIVDETTGVVAIVAQFGDFPIERELIYRVANSEQLI